MASVKEKLRNGGTVVMLNPDHSSASLVEYASQQGIDAIFVDCEHGDWSYERIDDVVRAAHLHGTAVILRPDHEADWRLTRYLDRGIDGLMVPHVETIEAARAVVEAVRYARPNDHAGKVLILMVESIGALGHLDAMLDLPEVDGVFCGSGDLAKSMGYKDKFHPEVRAKVEEVMGMIAAKGKAPGRMVRPEDVAECRESGARLLYIHANELFRAATKAFLAKVQS